MNHGEKREWLIRYLLDEGGYQNPVPNAPAEQKRLLRSLFNVRMPRPATARFFDVQDEYLGELARERGVVDVNALTPARGGLCLWQGDICRLNADAIVNAANSQMLGCFVPLHSCIDNCIHTFAGAQLRAECARQMAALRAQHGPDYEQPTAVPMLTDAYSLPARKVVHIVGPIVEGRLTPALERDLADCYANTLALCRENGLRSVAFCCISTGVFRFPADRAAEIAVGTVSRWMDDHPGDIDRVAFNVFRDEDLAIYSRVLSV